MYIKASKAYSKTWSFREDAMLEVYKTMMEMSPSEPREEAKNSIKAALFLISRALKDKVHAVSVHFCLFFYIFSRSILIA